MNTPHLSAGLLMCRLIPELQFFLVHPGGPFYQNKNEGIWTIPKGLAEGPEDLLSAAIREFKEETGIDPNGHFEFLGTSKMKSGKIIHAWTFLGDWNPSNGIKSNTFPLEWPPKSGKIISFPEADRAMWFNFKEAVAHIHPAQIIFLEKARRLFEEGLQ